MNNTKNDAAVIGGSTESVDLAALLMALGFHLIDAKIIESIDISSSRGRQQPKTMSWTFSRKSLDNQYDMDKVKGKWKLPKAYTLDAIPLSRLLAHNLAMLKSLARQPRNVIFSDLGGIGIISDYPQSKNSRDIMIHNSGIGGVSDSATAALAITLGVIPQDIVLERGRLSVSFLKVENQVSINDIQHIMKDDKMRHPENMHAVAILVCQLDNRQTILENMDNIKRNRRIIADGGETQVMYNPDSVSDKDKERIKRFLG